MNRLGNWLYKNQYIDESEVEVVRFGVELLFSDFCEFMNILILGCIIHKPYMTFMFVINFRILRRIFGGRHANSLIKCHIMMYLVYIICLITAEQGSRYLFVFLFIVNVILISNNEKLYFYVILLLLFNVVMDIKFLNLYLIVLFIVLITREKFNMKQN